MGRPQDENRRIGRRRAGRRTAAVPTWGGRTADVADRPRTYVGAGQFPLLPGPDSRGPFRRLPQSATGPAPDVVPPSTSLSEKSPVVRR
jgi:hypothetical protein